MRALITNDDGIDSAGLRALAATAASRGLDVMVAAPSWDSSGASASLTAVERDGRLLLEEERVLDALPGVTALAVEAAPAFIVRAAVNGAFGPRPDVVLSGINHGPNIPLEEITGFEQVRLAAFGAVQTTVTATGAGYVKLAYEDIDADLEPGTDAAALAAGAACYTPLRAACDVPDDEAASLSSRFTTRSTQEART